MKKMLSYAVNPVGVLSVINLILAVTALLRDIFFASYLGTTKNADAFLLAMFIPDTAGNLLLAAAVGIAGVPVFAKLYVNRQYARLGDCIRTVGFVVLLISIALTCGAYLFGRELIDVIGKGMTDDTSSKCLQLLYIFLPMLLLYPQINIGYSVLQVFHSFLIPSLAPVLFNLIFFGGILYCLVFGVQADLGVRVIAISVLAGAFAMLALVWGAIFSKKEPRRIILDKRTNSERKADHKAVFASFFPYLVILLTGQSVLLAERFLASQLGIGAIAGLNYAYRLSQFPNWVFVSALGVVILPAMSKAVGRGDESDIRAILLKSVWFVLLITLPLTIIIFGLRVPIVAILLQRGAFDIESLRVTAGILAGYSLVIVTQSLTYVFLRLYLAWQELAMPLLISLAAALFNIAVDFILVRYFGAAALGYGAALGSLLNALAMFYAVKRRLKLSFTKQTGQTVNMLLANLPVLVCTLFFNWVWTLLTASQSELLKIGFALAVIVSCSLLYLYFLRRLKLFEAIL